MRKFIAIVENASQLDLHNACRAVALHFEVKGQYFFEGDCLNFAVAVHEWLEEQGVPSEVKLVMRSDSEDGENVGDDVLSHVVVEMNGTTYDCQGRNALEQWETDFNHVRQMNGEDGEDFWLEDLPEAIGPFLTTANAQHGDTEKLVDKPDLREAIKAFLRTL